ncbi:quinone-dependent dihydroorotate dehydrogenase [Hoyosella subflava]|uniref:Dihydroorotate dehydrogenase (quinone) n=1 Tax=Hoyosella subflava (strain DSM 45089 / JCM 17490 / NBRC 109087 / DQS3-9A1) TaxID=443218 RepID=F6ENC9_HOYSD|nr:quinone-dependent dihydroorotate dehydrogenase [Hoyosella subflava]AEF40400.1 Dihydroorotate dehydrogenase [Hoyosella subflava DQS3-9A1]
MYRILLRVMFLLPPEAIHRFAFGMIKTIGFLPPLRWLTGKLLSQHDPILRTTTFGVAFPAPLGLAAGFDKNAAAINAWGPLGFGYAEIGTVTAHPQPGNPSPRLYRLPADHALINRMGFNNHGAGFAANKLRTRRTSIPVGANIGKTKIVPPEEAANDYIASAQLLGPLSDFLVVNVSSPNTPGLRDLQAVESLRPLLAAITAAVTVPVLVKIAPDLSDDDIDAIADLAVELGLAGIVATNTTIARNGLNTPGEEVAEMGAGGLSGVPVADRSLEVLRRLYRRVGGKIALVSAGGIETVDQAWQRIEAGATLLQGYTGYIYGGPLWPRRINKGIAQRLRAQGYSSLAEAVGAEHRSPLAGS